MPKFKMTLDEKVQFLFKEVFAGRLDYPRTRAQIISAFATKGLKLRKASTAVDSFSTLIGKAKRLLLKEERANALGLKHCFLAYYSCGSNPDDDRDEYVLEDPVMAVGTGRFSKKIRTITKRQHKLYAENLTNGYELSIEAKSQLALISTLRITIDTMAERYEVELEKLSTMPKTKTKIKSASSGLAA